MPTERDEEMAGLVRAVHGMLSRSSSASAMDSAMQASGFPLVGDQVAFVLLHHLAHLGPTRPTDVADAMMTGRSNVSKISRRLEEAGLLERRPDPRDERQVRLQLTAEGRRIGDRVVALSVTHFARALDAWPSRDLTELRRLLGALDRALADAMPLGSTTDVDP